MTRKGCAECTLSNSILERGLPGRNLYSLEPAAQVVRRELTNTWRAIARQAPAVLVANRPPVGAAGGRLAHEVRRLAVLGGFLGVPRLQRRASGVGSAGVAGGRRRRWRAQDGMSVSPAPTQYPAGLLLLQTVALGTTGRGQFDTAVCVAQDAKKIGEQSQEHPSIFF